MFWKTKATEPQEPPAQTLTSDFRSGRFRVTLEDDEHRVLRVYENCTNVQTAYCDVQFRDEASMFRKFSGYYYIVEEV